MTSIPNVADPTQHAACPPYPGAPKVLVIDDLPAIRRALIEALRVDYHTLSAADGERGLRAALSFEPDLVILDIGLPGMDGHAVLRALRAHPTTRDAAVLVVTGESDRTNNLTLLREGAHDLLLKPFCLEELQVRVHNLVTAKVTRDTLNATIGQHEDDLVRLAHQVADQQRQLKLSVEELQRAREVAEQASRTQSNFLRIMSHELRTPVTALQLHVHLIERSAAAVGATDLHDGIVRMERSSRRLLHLVSTFLEWSRAHRRGAQLTIEEGSLEAMAHEVAEEMRAHAEQKGLRLDVHACPLPLLRTDLRIARLLLVHLVYRAVQISREGTLHLRLATEGTTQHVSVHDTAQPLTPLQRQQALELLEDGGDIMHRAGAGSGLGLRIVRDIAGSVHGDLRVGTPAGRGNAWTLVLPQLDDPATLDDEDAKLGLDLAHGEAASGAGGRAADAEAEMSGANGSKP